MRHIPLSVVIEMEANRVPRAEYEYEYEYEYECRDAEYE